MIDASQLNVEHRAGSPPPTAERLGTFTMPDGHSVIVTWGRGRVLLCWWLRGPGAGCEVSKVSRHTYPSRTITERVAARESSVYALD